MKREAWRLTICAICLMIVMGGALYNFGLLLLQKLHSMIIKFKTSSELQVQLQADARQKSYE